MEINEFLRKMEIILERKNNSLTVSMMLSDIQEWDSLTLLGFIAMADTELDKQLELEKIAQCKSVNDLYNLIM